jgi:hypothetical protein
LAWMMVGLIHSGSIELITIYGILCLR